MLKRVLQSLTCALLVSLSTHSAHAINESQLPDIGTAGVSALSIDREILYGNPHKGVAVEDFPRPVADHR